LGLSLRSEGAEMAKPIHFDLSADQPDRAVTFYRKVFDWKIEKWEGPEDYWLINTGNKAEPGITGGIAGRIKPEDSTALVFNVDSVDHFAKRVEKSGGKIREPKRAIPGVGYLI
jgi:predicted enzyme related to lactoylglutathione lyase